MRYGASTFIWTSPFTDERAQELAPHVAELGFDVLEICIEDPALVTADAVGAAAERADVGLAVCAAFGPGRDLSHDIPEERRGGLEYMRACIDLAAAVGAPDVIGPMYSEVGKTRMLSERERDRQRGWAADSICEMGEYAGERGVGLAIEPLNRFETDLVNTVEQGLDLCERVGLPNVGLLLDTFHMNIEEKSIPGAVRLAGSRLRHFHACENDRGAPGSGHVEWDATLGALREIGFDGIIALESFTPDNEAIARAVSLWRPLAASPDDLARDGLTFLRDHADVAA